MKYFLDIHKYQNKRHFLFLLQIKFKLQRSRLKQNITKFC